MTPVRSPTPSLQKHAGTARLTRQENPRFVGSELGAIHAEWEIHSEQYVGLEDPALGLRQPHQVREAVQGPSQRKILLVRVDCAFHRAINGSRTSLFLLAFHKASRILPWPA
eukprot:scaffold7052_cov254-Pinguiococcus_pyrenoidosus.AAC.10